MSSEGTSLSAKVRKRRDIIAKKLLEWGKLNPTSYPWRERTTPYSVLISELLLRKTRADKVSEVFPSLLKEIPTVGSLSNCSPERLEKVVYTLGRLKRVNEILAIARKIEKDYSGVIPSSEKELLSLIGNQSKYTINAIRCFAYGERVPIFDVNVNRILSRVFSVDFGKQPHKNEEAWKLAETLLPRNTVKEYNWGLLDLGRAICTTEPKCCICPLVSVCDYASKEKVAEQR